MTSNPDDTGRGAPVDERAAFTEWFDRRDGVRNTWAGWQAGVAYVASRKDDMCRQHGEALQRIGSLLSLPPGSNLHVAVERHLRASLPSPPGAVDADKVDATWIRNAALKEAYAAMFEINGDKATRFDAQTAIRKLMTDAAIDMAAGRAT